MTRFALAAALVVASAWLEWGWAVPARRAASISSAEYRDARASQQEARVAVRERRQQEARERRAEALLETEGRSADGSLTQLRARTLTALDGRALGGVRLQVRPHGDAGDGLLFLSAEGDHQELLRLPGELVRAEPGLILQRVALRSASAGRLALELQARWAGMRP